MFVGANHLSRNAFDQLKLVITCINLLDAAILYKDPSACLVLTARYIRWLGGSELVTKQRLVGSIPDKNYSEKDTSLIDLIENICAIYYLYIS